MSYFVRFLLLCCTVALAIPTYANALNERDAVVSRQTGKLQIRVHYPITGNARVDADVADWAHQAVDTFQNTYGEEPDLGVPYELETTYSTTRSTPFVLSIVWKTASYTGGAHGIYMSTFLNFDLRTLAPIRLDDLFVGDYKEQLTDLLWNQLMADNKVATRQELEDMGYVTTGDLTPTENFYLSKEGITFYYNVYDIAPYVMGPVKITLPYEMMQHLLSDDTMALNEVRNS